MTNPHTLAGKRILLGVTGGIAAYKCAELTRLLVKAGADVTVMMSESAREFVTPTTMQALSGKPVALDLWSSTTPNAMPHISLSRYADLILVAPVTANAMAKLAHGLADDLLTTTCLARDAAACPLFIAPAMNREMWDQSSTQRNLVQLRADGVIVLGPTAGEQACGETGLGRMLEPEAIIAALLEHFARIYKTLPLFGVRALVTAGPTVEAIDAVRAITNQSSGKMGYAIASALVAQGARVTLVSGPTALASPIGVRRIDVLSAKGMLDAVNDNLADVKLFFAVAAVADYTPDAPIGSKIKKTDASLTIELRPTVDILAAVASGASPPFCVGFAAESDQVIAYAAEKRARKNLPMIVANHAGRAIGSDDNEVTIIDADGVHPIPRGLKSEVAHVIVTHAIGLFRRSLQQSDMAGS